MLEVVCVGCIRILYAHVNVRVSVCVCVCTYCMCGKQSKAITATMYVQNMAATWPVSGTSVIVN